MSAEHLIIVLYFLVQTDLVAKLSLLLCKNNSFTVPVLMKTTSSPMASFIK